MPKEGVEIVNFTLNRIHSYINGQTTEDTTPVLDPSVKEFQSLIKQLSGESGLDKLIKDTPTQSSFRYRRYGEVSEFLRGLTLNFPEITSLQRYRTYYTIRMYANWSWGTLNTEVLWRAVIHKRVPCLSLKEHC